MIENLKKIENGMAIHGVFGNVGLAFGPMIATIALTYFSWKYAYFFFGLINLIIFFFTLKQLYRFLIYVCVFDIFIYDNILFYIQLFIISIYKNYIYLNLIYKYNLLEKLSLSEIFKIYYIIDLSTFIISMNINNLIFNHINYLYIIINVIINKYIIIKFTNYLINL
mgnify:CR=1 FL=1